jgi:hypothetical protein
MSLDDFPESIRPHAERCSFCGAGVEWAPRVYGWIAYSNRGSKGGVAYDVEAKKWLKSKGFTFHGGKWGLRDDRACGVDITATWKAPSRRSNSQ